MDVIRQSTSHQVAKDVDLQDGDDAQEGAQGDSKG